MSRYAQPRTPPARTTGMQFLQGVYLCPELRPSELRVGCNAAQACPSRIGNRLHWPDGRVTDIDNNPLPRSDQP